MTEGAERSEASQVSRFAVFVRGTSLQARVVILLAIAILPVGFVGIWQAVGTASEASRLEQERLVARTRNAAEEEKFLLAGAQGVLQGVAAAYATDGLSRKSCDQAMARITDSDPRYAIAAIILKDGVIACASREAPEPGVDALVSGWGLPLLSENEMWISSGAPSMDVTLVNIARRLFRDGEHVATAIVGVPTSLLKVFVRAEGREDFNMAILDWRGNLVADSVGTGPVDWWSEELRLERDFLNEEQIVTRTSASGAVRVYAIVPVVPGEFFAVGSWSADELIEDARSRTRQAVFYPAIVWLIALGVSYFAVHRLAVRHISYLRRVMMAFANGRRSVRASGVRSAAPEIAELGRSFDQLAAKIEQNEDDLEHSLEEKTTLLREVHHRVKNNLQLVISMMNMQMRRASDPRAREAIQGIANRVMSLASVHQLLYQVGDLTAVRCDQLIREIVDHLIASDPRSQSVRLTCDLGPLELDADRAIPLALITTELIINALKYSGDDSAEDQNEIELRIELAESKGGMIELSVMNRFDTTKELDPGTGTQLNKAFARQLGGELSNEIKDGEFRVSLTFRKFAEQAGEEQSDPGDALPQGSGHQGAL